MHDLIAAPFVLAGLAIAAVAFLWLVVNGFSVSRLWGAVLLLFFPTGLVFLFRHPRKAAWPFALGVLGAALAAGAVGYNVYAQNYVDLGPRDKIVDGERHVTLTGWDRTEYGVLKQIPDVAVLQMANPDVTDATLKLLEKADKLHKLDLRGTAVTDDGLAELARFPKLATLYLGRTAITDEGFRQAVSPLEGLREVDLTGTKVTGKTKREWKAATPGRKYTD